MPNAFAISGSILGYIYMAGAALCCSALGYWFYARSLEVLGMSVSAIFINPIPVVSVIGGVCLSMWEGRG